MYDFDKHLSALAKQTVLCVGDLMLDEFVYGDVSRISPEAPTPVIAVKRTELMIGGAPHEKKEEKKDEKKDATPATAPAPAPGVPGATEEKR